MVPRSAEECRRVLSGAGKGWGRPWGAFKLLYYHCNTTKIDRVEQQYHYNRKGEATEGR